MFSQHDINKSVVHIHSLGNFSDMLLCVKYQVVTVSRCVHTSFVLSGKSCTSLFALDVDCHWLFMPWPMIRILQCASDSLDDWRQEKMSLTSIRLAAREKCS